MKTLRSLYVVLALAASPLLADTYTVTSTGDSGPGTLRQAITDANGHAGADTIAFAIPSAGVQTITPITALPNITEAVTINGYSQPGASPNTHPLSQGTNAVLLVEIDCEAVPVGTACLTVTASNVTIRGVVVNRDSDGPAIAQSTGDNLVVAGSFIGTSPDGGLAGGPQYQGIRLGSGSGHVVGGPNPADRNVISGNRDGSGVSGEGILLLGDASATIQGNFVGLDAAASSQVPNGNGIHVSSTGTVHIGGSGAGEGNIVAGNNNLGIYGSAATTLLGNFVGTDTTGTRALPNRSTGVYVTSGTGAQIGGLAAGEGNVIAFNGGGFGPPVGGILVIGGTGIAIRGNRIYGNVNRGIALTASSPTPNDAGDGDSGPNGYQNYPMLSSVDYGASTTVHATLNSKASTLYDIDFYANPACVDLPPLNMQGKDYVGSTQVSTNASGDAAIDFTLPVVLQAGQPVTMVATDPGGNSSEFSQSILLSNNTRSGPPAGGTSLVLFGQQFESGAVVTFGGVPAASAMVSNPNIIQATSPVLPAGSVNDIKVANPSGTAGTLDNSFVADFLDVPNSNNFYNDVIKLVANEITVGVGGGIYGVGQNIKRQAMAVFILKAEHGKCYTPPSCHGVFGDVACPSTFADWIEAMAAEGITGGCGGGNFCPQNPVRRDQMAVFLLKGTHGSAYTPPPCAGIFSDVPCPGQFADWIEQMKAEGITSGCGGTNYCPSANNSRGQMATFIAKTFLLN